MAITIKIEHDFNQGPARIQRQWQNAWGKLGSAVRAAMMKMDETLKRNASGPIIKRRTGHLVQSIQTNVTESPNSISGITQILEMFPNYPAVLEFGATIRAKHTYTTKHGKVLPGRLKIPTGFLRDAGGHLMPETSSRRRFKVLPGHTARSMPGEIFRTQVTIPAFRYFLISAQTWLNFVPGILKGTGANLND